MTYSIAAATVMDAGRLARLNNHGVHQRHHARRPDVFKAAREDELTRWFEATLARAEASAWIASRGGDDLGYVLSFEQSRPESPFTSTRRWCQIDQVAVLPAARGRGVARALIEAAIERARGRGIERVELTVWSFNADARAAFERLGFRAQLLRMERAIESP